MNRLFRHNTGRILSVYFTAGYPRFHDTQHIITALAEAGADMIEIGMPFSDPLADGLTIQDSNSVALQQGMTLSLLFDQLARIREHTDIPLILMGYLNPVLQYGMERFCRDAASLDIDGVILPDLPPPVWIRDYRSLFDMHGLEINFLITPQTQAERIRLIDACTGSFTYLVTASGTTGREVVFSAEHTAYFSRVKQMGLNKPLLAGFGIRDRQGFEAVCRYTAGAIIGSSFIDLLRKGVSTENIKTFIKSIKG